MHLARIAARSDPSALQVNNFFARVKSAHDARHRGVCCLHVAPHDRSVKRTQ
jgi:hypothetical protein